MIRCSCEVGMCFVERRILSLVTHLKLTNIMLFILEVQNRDYFSTFSTA